MAVFFKNVTSFDIVFSVLRNVYSLFLNFIITLNIVKSVIFILLDSVTCAN